MEGGLGACTATHPPLRTEMSKRGTTSRQRFARGYPLRCGESESRRKKNKQTQRRAQRIEAPSQTFSTGDGWRGCGAGGTSWPDAPVFLSVPTRPCPLSPSLFSLHWSLLSPVQTGCSFLLALMMNDLTTILLATLCFLCILGHIGMVAVQWATTSHARRARYKISFPL